MLKPIFLKGIIEFNNVISVETHKIRLKTEIPFDFEQGQFITITVAPVTKRSYSIASQPGMDYIELIADTRAGGPGSQFFANAKEGDVVEILGPLGIFTYKQNDGPLIFWSTGTGVVPFMSIIEGIYSINPDKKVILNTSFKHEEDIFAKVEFENLALKYKNFTYNLYITQPGGDWKGLSGRITEYFANLNNAKDFDHYLCGVKPMVEDIQLKLKALGVPDEQVHFEKY